MRRYEETELCRIALKWGTDKTPLIYHPYTPFYTELLRGRDIRRVLEIGIDRGASLRMWREYFPAAQIFGLDVRIQTLFTEERIETRLCDASDAAMLASTVDELGGNFDLIVDDGDHLTAHQILAVNVLLPFLSPEGVYVIEDVTEQGVITSQLRVPHSIYKTYPFDDPGHTQANNNCLVVVAKADLKT
jgi:predicted O-methyltransferase YrrM